MILVLGGKGWLSVVSYLILCRSLTYAQQMSATLERSGIKGRVSRVPRNIAGDGCGYCVRIAERNFGRVLELLRAEGLTFKQVYMEDDKGSLKEVKT